MIVQIHMLLKKKNLHKKTFKKSTDVENLIAYLSNAYKIVMYHLNHCAEPTYLREIYSR